MSQLAYWVAHVDEVIAAMVVLIAALFTKLTTDYKRRPLTSAVQHLKTRPYTIAKAVLLGFVIFCPVPHHLLLQHPRIVYRYVWGPSSIGWSNMAFSEGANRGITTFC